MDHSTGRWNRVDPFDGRIRDPQSLHKYTYVHNNPATRNDPSGLFTLIELLVVLVVILVLFAILAPVVIAIVNKKKRKNFAANALEAADKLGEIGVIVSEETKNTIKDVRRGFDVSKNVVSVVKVYHEWVATVNIQNTDLDQLNKDMQVLNLITTIAQAGSKLVIAAPGDETWEAFHQNVQTIAERHRLLEARLEEFDSYIVIFNEYERRLLEQLQ